MNDPPIVAELVGGPSAVAPRPAGNRRAGCGSAGCLAVALVLLVGLVLVGVGYGVYMTVKTERENFAHQKATQKELLAQSTASPARQDEIVAAFSAAEVGVPAGELARIQAVFNSAFAVKDRKASDPAVARLFDVDAYAQRFFAWPEAESFTYLERNTTRKELAQTTVLDWMSAKFRVTHVDLGPGGQSVTAYGFLQYGGGANNDEQRWHLVRRGVAWKLCDAEQCEQARWRSQWQARHFQYAWRKPAQWGIFESLCEDVNSAGQLLAEGKRFEAERKLSELHLSSLDRDLADELRTRILNTYEPWRSDAGMSVARQFHSPDQWPMAWIAIARGEAGLRNWPGAIEAGGRYMARVGPTPDVCHVLLEAHEALADEAACRELYRHLLRVQPDDLAALASLASLGPEDTADVLRRLAALPKNIDKAVPLLYHVDDDQHPEISDALIGFIERAAGDSPRLAEARANLASRRGESAAAAEIALAAAHQQAGRRDPSESLVETYFAAMLELNRAEEAVAAWPDPLAALKFTAQDYFYSGDYGVPLEAVRQAVVRARGAGLSEPLVRYADARLLAHDKNYAAAEQLLTSLLAELRDEDEEEFPSRGWVISDLASAQLKQGRVEDAVRTHYLKDDAEFGSLVGGLNLAEKDNRDIARRAIAARRAAAADDPWCGLCEAEIFEQDGQPERAWKRLPATSEATNQAIGYRVDSLRGRLVASGKIPLAWYEELPGRAGVFGTIAQELTAKKDWQQLAALIAIEQRSPKAPAEELDSWLAQ